MKTPLWGGEDASVLTEGNSLEVEGTDFKNITNAINSASAGDTIFLGGKTYTGSSQISISKNNITIIGGSETEPDKVATLDGQGLMRIMTITGSNVVIKNIKFINGNTTGYGGAIYSNAVNGTLNNCNFENNSAVRAGAVYWTTTGENGKIINSKFTNNKGAETAGAVYWIGANGTILSSIFNGNRATDGDGDAGAIIWYAADGTVKDCSFNNNSCYDRGGAVYWYQNNGTLSYCNFTNNSAKDGGAVFQRDEFYNLVLSNCYFANNTATGMGGAVHWKGANNTLKDSIFINNTASNYGGAVEIYGHDNIISDCEFYEENSFLCNFLILLFF